MYKKYSNRKFDYVRLCMNVDSMLERNFHYAQYKLSDFLQFDRSIENDLQIEFLFAV